VRRTGVYSFILFAALALAAPMRAAEVEAPPPPPAGVTAEDLRAYRRALEKAMAARLREAEGYHRERDFRQAAEVCDEILRIDPGNVEAQKLKYKAQLAQLEKQLAALDRESKFRDAEALLDLDRASNYPERKEPMARPRLPRREEAFKLSPKMIRMQQLLEQRVSVNFINADLDFVMSTLFKISGVNIIADQAVLQDKTLSLHVEAIPLKEILRFIVRNFDDLQYTVTEDAIWVTTTDKPPMEVRVYPLDFGLTASHPLPKLQGRQRGRPATQANQPRITAQQQQQQQQEDQQQAKSTYLEDLIMFVEGIEEVLPAGSQTYIDKNASSLVVYTTADGHEKVQPILALADKAPVQILISTRFIEIAVDDLRELGVDFGFTTTDERMTLDAGTGTSFGTAAGTGLSVLTSTSNDDPLFQATLRALEQDSHSKLLSAPQILALNNQTSQIRIDTQLDYVERYVSQNSPLIVSSETSDTVETETITALVPEFSQLNVGFTLEVTPSVGREMKTITLELHPEVSQAKGEIETQFGEAQIIVPQDFDDFPVIRRPIVDTRELRCRAVVEDGGILVIGGLMQQNTVKTENRVPILGSLPVLGLLFRSKSDTIVKSHLVIVVKAEIYHPSGRTYTDRISGGAPSAPPPGRPAGGPFLPVPEGPATDAAARPAAPVTVVP